MKRKSWMILGVSLALVACLTLFYLFSQSSPEKLTKEEAISLLQKMTLSFEKKKVDGILNQISPDSQSRLAKLSPDQIRAMLLNYFRNSERLHADTNSLIYTVGLDENQLQFDLVVHNDSGDSRNEDYAGHITLRLKRMEVPRLFGLFHAYEWRVIGAETTGPDPSVFGDYSQ